MTFVDALPPWYEIVGLVKDLGMGSAAQSQRAAGVYLPAAPGSHGAFNMIVHGRGDPMALAPRIREVATAVDPSLRIEQMTHLDQVVTPLRRADPSRTPGAADTRTEGEMNVSRSGRDSHSHVKVTF